MIKRTDKYKKSKSQIFLIIILCVLIFGISILLWARFISTSGLVVKETKIVNNKLPNSFNGFKIIHFSDVHYGKTVDKHSLNKIVNKINLIKPDLVLFTGDLIDKDTNIDNNLINDLADLLQKIETTHGKYAVKGNHDYTSDSYMEIMEKSDFTILENNYDLIYGDINEYIYLGGLSSSIKTNIEYEKALEYFNQDNNNIFSIIMLHEPDNIDTVLQYKNIDLALSGHSHGGQVRIPSVGPITKIKGAIKYPNNYYKVNDTELFVSSGIGTTTYPFRFMNKPSINFYRLYNK